MIFEKFKEDVVVEKGWADMKSIKKMAIHLAILMVFLALGFGMFTISTLPKFNTIATVFVLIMFALSYVWVIDLADEDEKYFRRTMKISKLWWLGFVFDVLMYLILHFFRFI